jgi:hypothetical protein
MVTQLRMQFVTLFYLHASWVMSEVFLESINQRWLEYLAVK